MEDKSTAYTNCFITTVVIVFGAESNKKPATIGAMLFLLRVVPFNIIALTSSFKHVLLIEYY